MLLGSVSAEIVERATCAVLVARSDHVSRLLIATDGSASAKAIPDVLASWNVFRGVPGEVISVAPEPQATYELLAEIYTLGSIEFGADREEILRRHRDHANQAAHRLGDVGIRSTSNVAVGDAAHKIVEAAGNTGADLIVLGSRGLRGLKRVLLGSVARNVVFHAPTSVLVVRAVTVAENGAEPRPAAVVAG
jgi:nucleotide-binding universal stress UspA family protein